MLTTERYTTHMSKRLLQGRNWNSERESLVSIFKAHRVRVAHPVIIRASKIMSFSNGSSKRNGPIESPASGSWR